MPQVVTEATVLAGIALVNSLTNAVTGLIRERRKITLALVPLLPAEMQEAIAEKSRELDAILEQEREWSTQFTARLTAALSVQPVSGTVEPVDEAPAEPGGP